MMNPMVRIFLSMAMAEALDHKYKELEGIDIKKEYELVQEKKSRLSKRLRDLVVEKYNKFYVDKRENRDEKI